MPAKKDDKIRVRFLGNHRTYDANKEYDLPVNEANEYTGMGIAVIVEPAVAGEEE